MATNENILADAGIRFFGKMSASATHEIKNTLAIINESAGLLEDLCLMAEKGSPLSLNHINDISQRVKKQVYRTDGVLKRLNQFSHSVDQSTQVIDLEQTVRFVLSLTSRLLDMQSTVVDVTPPISPIVVTANLFYLENMIWRTIETIYSREKENRQLKISFGNDADEPSIWFSMVSVKGDAMNDMLESKEDNALKDYLGIRIEKNNQKNQLGLLWPRQT